MTEAKNRFPKMRNTETIIEEARQQGRHDAIDQVIQLLKKDYVRGKDSAVLLRDIAKLKTGSQQKPVPDDV